MSGVAKAPACSICGRPLDVPVDPLSTDCGGDCLACMADAGDPDAVAAVAAIGIVDPNTSKA